MSLISRPIEQANLVLGCGGLPRTDSRRFALGVLNAALGGGMSSRLFQEVREKRGLAYSVYSFNSQLADTGVWGVYAGCQPAKTDDVLAICRDEIAKVVDGGITDAEMERGKGQLRGSIVLGLEDPSSRMSRLGKAELVYHRLEPVEEILSSIDAVTHDEIRAVAAEVLTRPRVLAVVGPFARELSDSTGQFAHRSGDGDAEHTLPALEQVDDLFSRGAFVHRGSIGEQRDVGQVLHTALTQMIDGNPDVVQRDPGVQQSLDDLEDQDVFE